MSKKITKQEFLQRAKEYAMSKGGECLASEYLTAKTKVKWKCANANHPIFEADFQIIYRENWCTLCGIEKNANKASLLNGLELAIAHALKNGGQCLSTEYKNAKTKMQWKCAEGHIWDSDYDHVVTKSRWCKQCGYNKALKKGFDKLAEQYAQLKNGYAILPVDRKVKTATVIKWKCSNPMHKEWEATYRNVVQKNGWCPYCAGRFSKEEYLDKAKKYAISKNGECLSNHYENQNTKLEFKCDNLNHKSWFSTYENIVHYNSWCKQCVYESKQSIRVEYLDKAKEHAISKGGKCLSNMYINNYTKLIWSCANPNHPSWEATYNNVVGTLQRWCPRCVGQFSAKEWIEKAKEHAHNLGGEFLSLTYTKSSDHYMWKCHNSLHKAWKCSMNNIINAKTWCPECGIYYQKENQVRKLLEYLLGFTLEKAKPEWNINPNTGFLLELDGYNETKKMAFEYQGRQHYEDNVFNNSNQTLEIIQYKDKIKSEHCRQQGIILIIIDGRKKRDTSKRMVKSLQKLLDTYNLEYKKDIDLDEVEKIYNAARIEKCDNSKK